MSLGHKRTSRGGRSRGNPTPKPRKHALPTATLSSADKAALSNIHAREEVSYTAVVGHVPFVNRVPEPGRITWAHYPARP